MRSERTRDAAIPPKENALPVPCIHRFIIFDVFFKIGFEASWIGFWRSKFFLFKLKLIFDRFFGPLQNQEGVLWGPFCRFREVKIEHPYHTLGVFSILGRFQETSK